MNALRKLFGLAREDSADAELGESGSIDLPDPQGEEYGGRRPTMLPPSDNLTMFRFLVGIKHTPSMSSRHLKGRVGRNHGIYPRVVRYETAAAQKFKIFSIVINCCLGLQIVVAAALTALGAANGSSSTVTVFGAINTVIAGFLTYLKGSGLPNRIKYYQNEWKRLRQFIEQREREFTTPTCKLDLYKTTAAIEQMYKDIEADIEANTPESYVSPRKRGDISQLEESLSQDAHSPQLNEKETTTAVQDVEKYEPETTQNTQQGIQDFGGDRINPMVLNVGPDIGSSSQFASTTDTLRHESKFSDAVE